MAEVGERKAAVTGRRARDLTELVVGFGLILAMVWSPRPWQGPCYAVVLVWIGVATWRASDGAGAMGLRMAGFMGSLRVVGVALLVAVAALLTAARLETLHVPQTAGVFARTFLGYVVWAFVQQFLLQDFLLLRLLRLLRSRRTAVLVASGLFAVVHLPSPILTGVTLVWGLVACWSFLEHRNVWGLGLAHAILGVCVAMVVPGRVDHNMKVGLGYLRYQEQPVGARGAAGREAADVWVLGDESPWRS